MKPFGNQRTITDPMVVGNNLRANVDAMKASHTAVDTHYGRARREDLLAPSKRLTLLT